MGSPVSIELARTHEYVMPQHPGPRILAWSIGDGPVPMLRDELALAVYWCRFGGLRPQHDRAFDRAVDEGYMVRNDLAGMVFATAAGEQHLARALFDAPYAEVKLGVFTGHPSGCACERCCAQWASEAQEKAQVRRELETGATA